MLQVSDCTPYEPLYTNMKKRTGPVFTDIRGITRDSNTHKGVVYIGKSETPWLVMGSCNIESRGQRGWALKAYLPEGVTDIEHDSGGALSLPIIGLGMGPMPVVYGISEYIAWVGPNAGEDSFHVPTPGYNPMEHPEATKCRDRHCDDHIIVPSSHWYPPFDEGLYEAVRGKAITIKVGPAW